MFFFLLSSLLFSYHPSLSLSLFCQVLQRSEAANHRVGVTMIETVGLGGVGKTQVAAEYCYRHYSSYYGLVMWWRAETPEVLASDVRRFAEDTGIVVQVRELLGIFSLSSFNTLLCDFVVFFSFSSVTRSVFKSFFILSVDLKKLKKLKKKDDESSRLFCFSSSSCSCSSSCSSSCTSSSSSSSSSLSHRE